MDYVIYLRYNKNIIMKYKNIIMILSGRVRVDRVERGHAGQPRAGRVHPRDDLPAALWRHSRDWLEVSNVVTVWYFTENLINSAFSI